MERYLAVVAPKVAPKIVDRADGLSGLANEDVLLPVRLLALLAAVPDLLTFGATLQVGRSDIAVRVAAALFVRRLAITSGALVKGQLQAGDAHLLHCGGRVGESEEDPGETDGPAYVPPGAE